MNNNQTNSSITKQGSKWIDECHQGIRYGMEGKVLIKEKSKFQEIMVIESTRYGKGLLLDGCWMTAEKQERHYHECLVHPALCSAHEIKKVLIIGGGDGGSAKECLRYSELEHLDMVEIDEKVIQISKKYLQEIGGMAWQDNRLHVKIENGINWAANATDNSYDVVIVDGSDPNGPAEGLFNRDFYKNCKRILRKGGVFATQSESPEAFKNVHIQVIKLLREVFGNADPTYGCVPMYPSGWWSWTFASTESPRYQKPNSKRAQDIAKQCEIWSPRWQAGAFQAIPAFIDREINK